MHIMMKSKAYDIGYYTLLVLGGSSIIGVNSRGGILVAYETLFLGFTYSYIETRRRRGPTAALGLEAVHRRFQ